MSKASQGLGDAVKGIFNTVHGAGEMIRGTINDSVDKVGEGIASEGKSTEPNEQRKKDLTLDGHAPQDHSATVNEGKDEVTKGIDSMKNAGK